MSDPQTGAAPEEPPGAAARDDLRTARDAPRGRWRLRWALAASVALNLLLAGLIAGAALRDARWHGARGDGEAPAAWSERRGGEPSLRAQVRAALEARAPAFEARRAALRGAWRDVRDAAQADPLEPARLDAALAALREAESALATERHRAFAALAAGMDPDQRARMLGAMASRFERRER